MSAPHHNRALAKEKVTNAAALLALLAIGALGLVGPSGVLAWGEQTARLEAHEVRIAELQEQRDVLRNRVDLLDPEKVDPDLATELVRGNLNVIHPDEYVVVLETID